MSLADKLPGLCEANIQGLPAVVLTSFDLSSTKFFVWSVVWGP